MGFLYLNAVHRSRSAVRRPLVPAIGVTVTIANACSDNQEMRKITGHSGESQFYLPCQWVKTGVFLWPIDIGEL